MWSVRRNYLALVLGLLMFGLCCLSYGYSPVAAQGVTTIPQLQRAGVTVQEVAPKVYALIANTDSPPVRERQFVMAVLSWEAMG
jgi:hypothetical protein